jgi:uncharacterized membrane protein
MGAYQLSLVRLIESVESVRQVMFMPWTWPAVESIHFLGLTLLFGSIGAWDLRLLGVGRGVPVAAFHRLIPFAVLGFAINVVSGIGFLMAAPDQYIYNPAFHLKMLLVAVAGLNVLVFYVTIFRRVQDLGPAEPTPLGATLSGAVSLACWMGVIVCGRMITFYRPFACQRGEALGFLADCIMP